MNSNAALPLSSASSDFAPALDPRLRSLSHAVGGVFHIFDSGRAAELLGDPADAAQVSEVVDAWLASPSLVPRYAVLPLDSHRCIALVCFRKSGGASTAAFAVMMTSDHRLLDQLVQTGLRLLSAECELDQRRNELQSCLEQLSYDLEEQSWLRGLSHHMQISDVRQSLTAVAKDLLPSLRQLIAAQSMVVLVDPRKTGSHDPRSNLSLSREGASLVPEHVFPSWLKRLDLVAQGNVRVVCGNSVESEIAGHGVRSYVAARLGFAHERAGWIVAFNKCDTGFASWRSGPVLPHGLSSQEFGSVEAGLMEAAAAMLSMHEHNVSLLRSQEELTVGVIRSMSSAIDARDPYTRGHSERVGRFSRHIAAVMGIDQTAQHRIYLAGLLHDVGKIGVPDHVLLKPGKLTEEEFAIIKQHPEIGARIVQSLPQLGDLLPAIMHHHESIDGAGYPHGLQGDEIPLPARIMAVADTYDAMTSHRPYRPGMLHEKAVEIIRNRAGIQWDVDAVQAFLSIPQQVLEKEAASDSMSDLSTILGSDRPAEPRPVSGEFQSAIRPLSP